MAIDASLHFGARGLALGMVYEAAARIALKQRHRERFMRWVRLCAKEYRGGSNAMREAKFARLLQEADEQELCAASKRARTTRIVI